MQATKDLLLARANVTFTWNGGNQKTAIYYAIRFRNAELVRLLLQHGTDVHRQMRSPKQWVSPLELARQASRSSAVYLAFRDRGLGYSPEPAVPETPETGATIPGHD